MSAPTQEEYVAALATLELPEEWTVGVVVQERQSFGLAAGPDGEVIIKVPAETPPEDVAAMVDANRAAIAEAVDDAQELVPSHPVKPLVDGTVITLAGRDYRLALVDGALVDAGGHRASSDKDGVLRVVRGEVDEMRDAIVEWLCREGVAWARSAGSEYERRGGIEALEYEVRELPRFQWGVFEGGQGDRVVLKWQTLCLPRELLDYVLVHELAHATWPEGTFHGPGWRAVMDAWMPDWRKRRRRLNDLAHTVWLGDCAAAAA